MLTPKYHSYSDPNVVYWNGTYGAVFGDGQGEIKSSEVIDLKKGDVVTTKASLDEGWIEWSLNGKVFERH